MLLALFDHLCLSSQFIVNIFRMYDQSMWEDLGGGGDEGGKVWNNIGKCWARVEVIMKLALIKV